MQIIFSWFWRPEARPLAAQLQDKPLTSDSLCKWSLTWSNTHSLTKPKWMWGITEGSWFQLSVRGLEPISLMSVRFMFRWRGCRDPVQTYISLRLPGPNWTAKCEQGQSHLRDDCSYSRMVDNMLFLVQTCISLMNIKNFHVAVCRPENNLSATFFFAHYRWLFIINTVWTRFVIGQLCVGCCRVTLLHILATSLSFSHVN